MKRTEEKVILLAPTIMGYFGAELRLITQDACKKFLPFGMYLLTSFLREHEYEVIILDLIANRIVNNRKHNKFNTTIWKRS